jgi:hypothetical protein
MATNLPLVRALAFGRMCRLTAVCTGRYLEQDAANVPDGFHYAVLGPVHQLRVAIQHRDEGPLHLSLRVDLLVDHERGAMEGH